MCISLLKDVNSWLENLNVCPAGNGDVEAKIAVFFIGKKSGITRHRELPIYLRITVNKKRFEVATHQQVDPWQWSPSAGRVKSKSDIAIETKMALFIASKKVYDYQDELYKEIAVLRLNPFTKNGLVK